MSINQYLEGVAPVSKLSSHVVIDLETFNYGGAHIPYAIGGFDGVEFFSEYLPSSVTSENLVESSEQMIATFFKKYLKKCKGKVIYCHNLSFDGPYLLKVLKERFLFRIFIYGDADLVSFDLFEGKQYEPKVLCSIFGEEPLKGKRTRLLQKVNNLYEYAISVPVPPSLQKLYNSRAAFFEALSIEERVAKKTYFPATYSFRDSLKLLPYSLRELAELLKVPTQKGYFPHNFVTLESLFYSGVKPALSYYDSVSQEVYDSLSQDFDLPSVALDYLEKDCRALFEVLSKFKKLVHEWSGVDVAKAASYSGLAFLVYLHEQVYKKGTRVYKFTREEDAKMRTAYFGGSTEVFKPYCKGELYYYDINSLYPSCMLQPMPVGKPVPAKIESLDTFFGFVECTVDVPLHLNYPVLPIRHPKDRGQYMLRGSIKGMWFSEELKYAVSLGCRILEYGGGWAFDKGDLFSDFVTKYFQLRSTSEDIFQKRMAKLILNGLYGKMGQRFYDMKYRVVFESEFYEVEENHRIVYATNVKTDGPLGRIEYKGIPFLDKESSAFYERALGSVAVSAAISSYGRIKQYQIIHANSGHIYYTDTDSFVSDQPITQGVGSGLGELRLEGVFHEGYFLAPKIYALRNENGKCKFSMCGVDPQKVTFADFEKLYQGKEVAYPFKKLVSLGSLIYNKEGEVLLKGDFAVKRIPLFDTDNRWVDTAPYHIMSPELL